MHLQHLWILRLCHCGSEKWALPAQLFPKLVESQYPSSCCRFFPLSTMAICSHEAVEAKHTLQSLHFCFVQNEWIHSRFAEIHALSPELLLKRGVLTLPSDLSCSSLQNCIRLPQYGIMFDIDAFLRLFSFFLLVFLRDRRDDKVKMM